MKKMLVVSFLAFSVVSYADEDAVKKYRNYTPKQIEQLSEKGKGGVPLMYLFAAGRGLSEGASLVFSMELNSLMYPGIHFYEQAVKLFQKDLGDEPTGAFTVWQIHNLQFRSEMQKLSEVTFPERFSSYMTEAVGQVQGTIMLHDERIAWPVNHVKLLCFKYKKVCELNRINLEFPEDIEDTWMMPDLRVFESDTELYDITNWGEDTIDAIPSDPGNGCRRVALNLNFKTKEFYEITRNGTTDCDIQGLLGEVVRLPRLPKPRIAQIVDGERIIRSEFDHLKQKAFNMLSSSFKEKVEQLETKLNKSTNDDVTPPSTDDPVSPTDPGRPYLRRKHEKHQIK